MELTPMDYQRAIDVQDACNLSGVVHALASVLPKVRADVNGTDAINAHPIVRLYVDKLADLSGMGFNRYEGFSEAYDLVIAGAQDD